MKFFSLHFSNKFITAVGFQLILFKKVLNSNDDLYKNGIFTDDENEIANNIARKVKLKEYIEKSKNKKKDNFELE